MALLQVCMLTASLIGSEPAELSTIGPLVAALRDRDVEVRYYAGAALAELGTSAVDPLVVALQDPDRYQRSGAAYALGRLGGTARSAKPQLLKALSDEDRDVRRHAAYALGRILASEREDTTPAVEPPVPGSALPPPEPVVPVKPK